MIITIILLTISCFLFIASILIIGQAKDLYNKYKLDTEDLQKMVIDNINLSKQLYKSYVHLQDNQKLQIKALDLMSKHQKLTTTDLNEFREQMSSALVAIVENTSGGSSTDVLKNKDKTKAGKSN